MLQLTRRPLALAAIALPGFAALPAAAQTLNEDIKIVASDPAADDQFGRSVAISGTTAIVGVYQDDDAGLSSGSAYLFDTTTGDQIAKLTASDAMADDRFGFSVAISGTTAIIGAYRDDGVGTDSGSAYLFDTETGTQIAKLTASDEAADDWFGHSVAILGTTAIVGAYQNDDAGSRSGSAYLFDTETGIQIAKLTANDATGGDFFGWSVALSNTTAIIGANGDDDGGNSSGSVYLFDIKTGTQITKITASDAASNAQFGVSVAISGTTALVGAFRDDSPDNKSGSAYLFDTKTGVQITKLTPSDSAAEDEFGRSVSISGTIAIIGARGNDDAGSDSGSAYLFDTETWVQIAKITASDAATEDQFARSVAISGTTAIIGAINNDDSGSNSGSAYLTDFAPDILQEPLGTIVAAGETAEFSVLLSGQTITNFQWRRNGINLVNAGNISGAQSPTLQIVASADDIATYDCVVTDIFGSTTTNPVVLAIMFDPNECVADINNDGRLNFFDISAFLQAFSAGCP
jgi:FG-GAP repeat protein